jgi:hypothetical protein
MVTSNILEVDLQAVLISLHKNLASAKNYTLCEGNTVEYVSKEAAALLHRPGQVSEPEVRKTLELEWGYYIRGSMWIHLRFCIT